MPDKSVVTVHVRMAVSGRELVCATPEGGGASVQLS